MTKMIEQRAPDHNLSAIYRKIAQILQVTVRLPAHVHEAPAVKYFETQAERVISPGALVEHDYKDKSGVK